MEPLEPTPEAERNTVGPEQVDAAVSVAGRIADNVRRAVKVTDDVLEHVIVSLLAEGHVLVEDYPGVGKTALARALSRPFMVFATQNPVEYEGTYPLPEAQVDRFMIRVSLGYPNADEEAGMLAGHEARDRVLDLEAVPG